MPRPTANTALQRPDLGAIAYEYLLAADQIGYIAGLVFPLFESEFISADYPVIPIEAFLKHFDTSRAPRGPYNRGDYEFKTGTFKCEPHGWEEPVDDDEARMYARYFDAEVLAVQRATQIVLMDHEVEVANMCFNPSNFQAPFTAPVAHAWDAPSIATPKADVKKAIFNMRMASGIMPNVLIINEVVFQSLLMTQEFSDYTKYTNAVLLDTRDAQLQLLARYLNIGQVLVADGLYDSADKGQPKSLMNIWGDGYALLARISGGGQDLRTPCLGRTFLWTASSPQELVTEVYREEQKRSFIYRVRTHHDPAFVFKGAGYLLTGVAS